MNAHKLSKLAGSQIGDMSDLRRRLPAPSGDVSLFQLVCALVTCALLVTWIMSLRG